MSEVIENKSDSLPDGSENPWQKMADKVLAEKKQAESLDDTPESMEKSYFETETEFSPDKIKEFRENLLNADEEQTKAIIESRIIFLEESCGKSDEISSIHRGYIGSETKVPFEIGGGATLGSKYRLKDKSYLYEAVAFLQDNKERINNGNHLFNALESFLNSYFGIPNTGANDKRMDVVSEKLNLSELSDDDFFEAIDNIDINIFRGEHAAQCTERASMAQNILSLFGYETYFMIGDANVDGHSEGHAFNAVSDSTGQKRIQDFSITSTMDYRGTTWLYPATGLISDFDGFQKGDKTTISTYEGRIGEDGKVSRRRAHNVEYGIIAK